MSKDCKADPPSGFQTVASADSSPSSITLIRYSFTVFTGSFDELLARIREINPGHIRFTIRGSNS